MKLNTKCPECQKECTFRRQEFKNGIKYVHQECPEHGYIKKAPQTDSFISLCIQAENDGFLQDVLRV